MQALPPPPIDPVEAGLAKAQARLTLGEPAGLDAKALLAAVPCHYAFLRAAHRAGVSLRAPSAKTLERYESKWLPLLAAAKPGASLAPPPDVAWAWHCHRLAPRSYARTARRLGLPETAPFLIQEEGGSATEKAWAAAYPGEPFFLESDSGDDAGALVLDGFDVAAAAERQRTFLWQVSGPRFDEGYFLCDGARRYENFLRLMRSGEFLVPTYQIDLFWHTHILASASTYATEDSCAALLPKAPRPRRTAAQRDRSEATWRRRRGRRPRGRRRPRRPVRSRRRRRRASRRAAAVSRRAAGSAASPGRRRAHRGSSGADGRQ